MRTETTISDELATFLESGLAISLATRDGELQPDGAWVWAARVHDDRAHVTVFVHEQSAPPMLENLAAHPEIAVVFDQPTTHRACQLKGTFVSSRRARATERADIERQVEGFRHQLESIGIARGLMEAWEVWPCAALQFRVMESFEQSPGPGAGEPMK